jgi:hypothetical protein
LCQLRLLGDGVHHLGGKIFVLRHVVFQLKPVGVYCDSRQNDAEGQQDKPEKGSQKFYE